MLTEDLITLLQKLVDEHKASGTEEVMGKHEIMIDRYKFIYDGWNSRIIYEGLCPFIEIDYSRDGVYPIISWRDPSDEEKKLYGIK